MELVKVRVKLLVLGVHLFDENGARGGSYTGSEGETHTLSDPPPLKSGPSPTDAPLGCPVGCVCVLGMSMLSGAPSGVEEDESSADTRAPVPALDLDPCQPPSPPPLSAAAAPPCVPSAGPKPPSLSMLRSGVTGNTSNSSLPLLPTGSSSWLPSTQVGPAHHIVGCRCPVPSCPRPRLVMGADAWVAVAGERALPHPGREHVPSLR